MERNTLTTLGQLRVGDRFRYNGRVDVWQVTAQLTSRTAVNIPGYSGFLHKYDEMKKNTIQVIFMRHTIPLPGEQCLIKDLQVGDVFHLESNLIKEYQLEAKNPLVLSAANNPADKSACKLLQETDRVFFVRHAKIGTNDTPKP